MKDDIDEMRHGQITVSELIAYCCGYHGHVKLLVQVYIANNIVAPIERTSKHNRITGSLNKQLRVLMSFHALARLYILQIASTPR